MIRNTLTHLVLPVIASAALLLAAGPVFAQRGGHGGGGFHAGGGHVGGYGGGYHGGTTYHSGYHYGGAYNGGYHYGGYRAYRPYYGGYRAYPYYGGGWYYPYYGGSYYPYYYGGTYPYFDSSYIPSSDSGYAAPSTSNSASDSNQQSALVPDVWTHNKFSTDGLTVPATNSSEKTGTAALVTVRLPDNADLWFDDTKMTGTGSTRTYTTRPLASGRKYTYDIRARWLDNGTVMDEKQTVAFAPGDKVEVKFPTFAGSGEGAQSIKK